MCHLLGVETSKIITIFDIFVSLHLPRHFALMALASSVGFVACVSPQLREAPPRAFSQTEAGILRRAAAFNLVSLEQSVSGIWIEARYKGKRNVLGRPFYPASLPVLIHQDTAVKLRKAQAFLADRGYQLKVWDAYRPVEGHVELWKKFGQSGYVHEPGNEGRWSWHCYGRAVDVTLLDADGRELEMPTDFDEFSPRAWAAYLNGDKEVTERLRLLQRAMTVAGFEILNSEWWHFSDPVSTPLVPPPTAADLGC